VDELAASTEKLAREEPVKTVGMAFGLGIFLSILPLGRIIGGLARLAFSLLKPALLIFGAIKLFETCERRCDRE
jgi:hypothetical protein